jgi:hypothetical protein
MNLDIRLSAFSNLVLEELKERQRMPEVDDDDTESARNRAVNFSASPPEIIPRSQPNSPRTSQNLYPDEPPKERAGMVEIYDIMNITCQNLYHIPYQPPTYIM